MLRLESEKLWEDIDRLGKQRRSKLAAIAFVSRGSQVEFCRGDTLVCDASDHMIRTGQTSAVVLAKAVTSGARVYSYPGLHAKVLVVGATAVIGSANLSESSRDLTEASVVTDDPRLVGQAMSFVASLVAAKHRRVRVEGKYLEHLQKIKVVRKGWFAPSRKPRKRRRVTGDGSGWLSQCSTLPEQRESEKIVVEKMETKLAKHAKAGVKISWIRFGRHSSIAKTARVGQMLILAWRASKTAPVEVSPPVFIQRRVKLPTCVYLFYEEIPKEPRKVLGWREFHRLLTATGYKRQATPRSMLALPSSVVAELAKKWPRRRKR